MKTLLRKMDQHLVDSNIEKRARYGRKKNHWPTDSSVRFQRDNGLTETAGACLRKLYWDWKDVESDPTDARGLRIFRTGSQMEDEETDIIEDMGLLIKSNFRFQLSPDLLGTKYKLSGEIDGLVWNPDMCRIEGLEMKTGYGYNFDKLVVKGNKSTKPAPKIEHVMQVMNYLTAFNVDVFNIIYISRGDFGKKCYEVSLSSDGHALIDGQQLWPFTVSDVWNRFIDLEEYLAKEELPPRDYYIQYPETVIEAKHKQGEIAKTPYGKWQKDPTYPIGDWQCSYCGRLGLCKTM